MSSSTAPQDPELLLDRWTPEGIRLGLDRPRRLLQALGDPQADLRVILVTGTDGKGSTAAVLSSILQAAGLRVGRFTSPALERVEEQISVGEALTPKSPLPEGEGALRQERPVASEELVALLERVEAAAYDALGGPPTPFEALTAAAYLHFTESGVEWAVVEAGMGGARDATNVADPELAVVTSVSLEHRKFLGDTLDEIAREKAGGFRPGRPAVVFEALPALVEAAEDLGAPLHAVDRDTTWQATPDGADPFRGQRVELRTPVHTYDLFLPLAGAHQARNLALAVRAAELLGWADPEQVRTGVAAVTWPGRLEAIDLPDGPRVVLDAAHDPAATQALAQFLDSLDAPWDLLFGVLQDKEADRMLPPLAERAQRVVLTRPPGPRGRDPQELTDLLPPESTAEVVPDPAHALDALLQGPRTSLRVVTGSIVLVGAIRGLLRAETA